jgi:hypothetical protein
LDYTTEISIKELLLLIIQKKDLNLTNYYKNIKYITPVYFLPFRKMRLIKNINMTIHFAILKIALPYFHKKVDKKIIWMFFPQLSFISRIKIFSWKTIYDIVDIYSHPKKIENEKLKKQKKLLLRKSDYIFSISETLKKEFAKLTKKKIDVVPQGFDVDSFTKNKNKSSIKLPKNKIKIGFIGQINQRLDFNLLNKLIKNNPQWNFVFIGPKKNSEELFSKNKKSGKLINSPNCLWFNKQPKEQIGQIIKQFDIAMIPYDISLKFNLLCYPMKLFEYLYLEKPVVSTPIKELTGKKFKDIVNVGKNHQEWELIIKNIIKENNFKKKQVIKKEFAKKNSWVKKVEDITRKISFE